MRTQDDREPGLAAGPLEVHCRMTRVTGVDRAYQPHGRRPRAAERGRLVSPDQDGCVVLEGNGAGDEAGLRRHERGDHEGQTFEVVRVMSGGIMPEAMSYADVREQVRGRAVVIYGACAEDELAVLCRLLFWVLTASDEALTRVDQHKLGVVYGFFQAELALLSDVTTRIAEETRGKGLTEEAIGPLLEADVYREFLHQPYPPHGRQE
jgi:hypothetical protein